MRVLSVGRWRVMSINVVSSDRGWGVVSKMKNAMELPMVWDANRLGVVTCRIGSLVFAYDGRNVYIAVWDDKEQRLCGVI